MVKGPSATLTKVTVAEDTHTDQGAPSATNGTSTSLAVRGNPAYETYLRFNLSAAPAGQALKAAALQVKTSTQTGVGTADTVSPVPVTGTWSSAGTTFTTKPTLGTTPLGTFATIPDGSAVHSAQLAPPPHSPRRWAPATAWP